MFNSSYLVVDDFFGDAAALRGAFEAHFSNPDSHTPDHQVWNYWYVPEMYTYFRTHPTKLMEQSLIHAFLTRLNAWAAAVLGLGTEQLPWLSLYVNGCGQGLHNDSLNGQMGYVFSITDWEDRTFLGGETILLRPENYWESDRIKTSGAGSSFADKVPALFNRLLVFDDRVIHGVAPVQGTMDPLAGRVVLHGHLRAARSQVTGSLASNRAAALEASAAVLEEIRGFSRRQSRSLHGFLTLRLTIGPDGHTESITCLCDRIMPISADHSSLEPFKLQVFEQLSAIQFPSSSGPSEVTLPVVVGS
jgi:hypothetical protein